MNFSDIIHCRKKKHQRPVLLRKFVMGRIAASVAATVISLGLRHLPGGNQPTNLGI
jgi:RecG-like helicase